MVDNTPPIPPINFPRRCMNCTEQFLHKDLTIWYPLCSKCSETDYYLEYLRNRKTSPRPPVADTAGLGLDETHAVYFVTFTSEQYLDENIFKSRLERVLKSNAYPVVSHFGCFEFTTNGRLHMHVVFKHKLLRDKRGLYKYPCQQYYRTCNGGELVKKQKVKDQTNLDNVFNYITKDDQPILFGEKFTH